MQHKELTGDTQTHS